MAAKRTTTRIEDRAYCLMGLFNVNMPLLYGEGHKAFDRLQTAIINQSDDHTIFAWTDPKQRGRPRGLLAPDVSYFEHSQDIVRESYENVSRPYTMTNVGLQIQLEISTSSIPRDFPGPPIFAAPLNCFSDNGRVLLLLTYAGRGFSSDTDQFCRTDWCTLKDIDVKTTKVRTIFFKQIEYGFPTPEIIWIRNIPAKKSGYTLDRVVPSFGGRWDPERRFLSKPYLNTNYAYDYGSLTFTHAKRDNFEVSIEQRHGISLYIRVDSMGTDFRMSFTNERWLFSLYGQECIKIEAHVVCILGRLFYVLDINIEV